jgi:hypothetical protein
VAEEQRRLEGRARCAKSIGTGYLPTPVMGESAGKPGKQTEECVGMEGTTGRCNIKYMATTLQKRLGLLADSKMQEQ